MSEAILLDDLYGMANIHPEDSGLRMTVWVRPRHNEPHGPRIKVCTVPGARMLPFATVTVTLPDLRCIGGWLNLTTQDWHDVCDWIKLNEKAITDHWDGRISSIEFGRRLKRLP